MSDEDQLKALRKRIDTIDEKILDLISERAACAQTVAHVKQKALESGVNFFDLDRPRGDADDAKRLGMTAFRNACEWRSTWRAAGWGCT